MYICTNHTILMLRDKSGPPFPHGLWWTWPEIWPALNSAYRMTAVSCIRYHGKESDRPQCRERRASLGSFFGTAHTHLYMYGHIHTYFVCMYIRIVCTWEGAFNVEIRKLTTASSRVSFFVGCNGEAGDRRPCRFMPMMTGGWCSDDCWSLNKPNKPKSSWLSFRVVPEHPCNKNIHWERGKDCIGVRTQHGVRRM